MENVEIEEIVCLKSIKVVESKTNTGSEIVQLEHVESAMQWLCTHTHTKRIPDRPTQF